MFRANVDPAFVTVTDSLFCIDVKGMYGMYACVRNKLAAHDANAYV